MMWDRVADLITRRPGRVLGVALLPVLLPMLALPALRTTNDLLATLPPSTESVQGFRVLEEHMAAGEVAPLVLVIDGDTSVYEPAAFRALGDLSRNLRRLPGVASVRSAAMPTDGRHPADVDEDSAAEAGELGGRLQEAAEGARQLAVGIEQVGAGLVRIERELPASDELQALAGLGEAAEQGRELVAGLGEARSGVERLREGLTALRAGVAELEGGLSEAQRGADRLRTDVAVPTAQALQDAADALEDFTVGRADPRFREAAEAVGQAYGRVTGRFPPGHPREGEQVEADYDGLAVALGDLAAGLRLAQAGSSELADGLARLDAGLAELGAGLAAAVEGVQEALGAGGEGDLDALVDGLATLSSGIAELRAGVQEQLAPGARELQQGLAEGAQEIVDSGLADLVVDDDGGPFVLTTALLDAAPALREDLGFFVAHGERRTRLLIGLAHSPYSDAALSTVAEVRDVARISLLDSPLADATVVATGAAAFLDEVDRAVERDFPIIVAAVIAGVFVVLVVLLRSLVAPIYMVVTVLLSYGAALGAATIIVQGLLGEPGLQWWLPPLLFVLLVALGVDYSIFLMGRVREEAQHLPTRQAVAEGVRHTGRIITSAGVILAATFAALLVAPLRSLAQLGLAAAVGILLDTFVVRALLVPSLAMLVGRWNWWPSARAKAD